LQAEVDMTRGPSRILPVTLDRILRARQKVHSACQALIGWLKNATFNIEFGADFAVGTYRVIEPQLFNAGFNRESAALLPRTANVLPLIDPN
jgi:hypothetical protein